MARLAGRSRTAWFSASLRLAGGDRPRERNRVLARFLPRFNRRLWGARGQPGPCLAGTAGGRRARAGLLAPLPAGRRRRRDGPGRGDDPASCRPGPTDAAARQRVELELRLDGRLVVWDGERALVTTQRPGRPGPTAGPRLGPGASFGSNRPECRLLRPPGGTHPWRRITPGTKLYEKQRRERLTRITDQMT